MFTPWPGSRHGTSLSLTSHVSFNSKSCALYLQIHPEFICSPLCHQPGLSCHYLLPGRSRRPSHLSSSTLSGFLNSTPRLQSAQQSHWPLETRATSLCSSDLCTRLLTFQIRGKPSVMSSRCYIHSLCPSNPTWYLCASAHVTPASLAFFLLLPWIGFFPLDWLLLLSPVFHSGLREALLDYLASNPSQSYHPGFVLFLIYSTCLYLECSCTLYLFIFSLPKSKLLKYKDFVCLV